MLRKTLFGEYHYKRINICIFHKAPHGRCLVAALVCFLFLGFSSSFAQSYHTSSNRALRIYKEGLKMYDYFEYHAAEDLFKQAIAVDDKFYEAYMMLGELFYKQKRYAESTLFYRTAVKIDSLFYLPVLFNLANSEMMSGDYKNALQHYHAYLSQPKTSVKNRELALKNVRNCEFAIEAIKNPVQFNPISVGEGINTINDEYWPSITADGQTLMFTRQAKPAGDLNSYKLYQEDFYISYMSDDGLWRKAINAGPPLNTAQNEGAQTLSSDGSYMFFTACDRPGGAGSCDIYYSSYDDGKWSVPVNIGSPVNTRFWESQPSVSADGRILFFSSNRSGGFGGKDLWYSIRNEAGKWTTPVNMGKTVNTESDEMSPFIHFDGRTLYFSSDGRPGMGGFDIYVTRLQDDSTWSEPRNLGYPVNTSNDETGLVIESAGQKAYFSSVRDNNNGKDIFYFNLDESFRPDPVAYMKGKVIDKETGGAIRAEYELINITTGKRVIIDDTDAKGNFLVCLPSGFNYGLNVSKQGYLFYSEHFVFEGQHTVSKPYIKQILLSPLKAGETMLLSNVFYEVDSWQLKKESLAELEKLRQFLISNPGIVVEIGGYTDATGSDEYNQTLSEKRAMSVVNYLISKGIASERLKHKGYGNSSPVADNITTEGRKLNRRTEVKIL
ncbi:MAG: OmpA family protein [Bacteroidales bacterium]|jgi:outer membrane protein OmpA-like peptidoglycan-associated protein/tetratricopeptide (TPR) repeat protein